MIRTSRLPLLRRGYGAAVAMRNLLVALIVLTACAAPRSATADLRLLAFGDSLVQGYGLPEAQGFAPRLEAWLAANGAPDVEVVNAGVSGDTTAGGLARIGWALGDEVDAVIVVLGGNDMLRGIDPGLVRANLDGILSEIRTRDLPVLLAGIPAVPNYGEDYARHFRAVFPELAEAHGATLYRSFFTGLGQGRSPAEVMALMQPDGIHPSAAGVDLIVADIGPVVLDLIAEARARP